MQHDYTNAELFTVGARGIGLTGTSGNLAGADLPSSGASNGDAAMQPPRLRPSCMCSIPAQPATAKVSLIFINKSRKLQPCPHPACRTRRNHLRRC